ncbi:MAG: hypothetical protein AB9907_17870 [Flexilinea sp.]
MLKESDVSEKEIRTFRKCLAVVPSLKIDTVENLIDKEVTK